MKKFLNILVILSIFFVSCKMEYDVLKRDSNIESISVDTSAAKKSSYVVSESFDPTGIKVIAHNTDGTIQELDLSQVTFENFSSEEANEALPVTVKYQDFTATFNVCVKENEIVELRVVQKPKKLHYKKSEGYSQDNLELDGLIVEGLDLLGKKTILDEKEYSVLNFSVNNAINGINTLSIVYNKNQKAKSASLLIFFDDLEVSSVTISQKPYKTTFLVGTEIPDYSGLSVVVNTDRSLYEDYYYSIIPSDISNLTVGKHEIEIWVNDQKASFEIEIVDEYLAGITIDEDYKNVLFYVGDKVELISRLKIYEKYVDKNGIETSRKEQITTSTYLNLKRDNKVLKYSYNKVCQFEQATEIMVDNEPQNVQLTKTGKNTIYFYYRFTDINNKVMTVTYPLELIVGDSQLESITANWSGNGYPLGVKPDNSHPEYGKWEITGKLKNADSITIPAESCTYMFTNDDYNNPSLLAGNSAEVLITYEPVATQKLTCKHNVSITSPIPKGIKIKPKNENQVNLFRDKSYNFSEYFNVYKTFEYISAEEKLHDVELTAIYDKSGLEENNEKETNGFIYAIIDNFSDYYPVNFISKFNDKLSINFTQSTSYEDLNSITSGKDFKYNEFPDKLPFYINHVNLKEEKEYLIFTGILKTKAVGDQDIETKIKVSQLSCDKSKIKASELNDIKKQIYREYKGANNNVIKIKIKENYISYTYDEKLHIYTFWDTRIGKNMYTLSIENEDESGGQS